MIEITAQDLRDKIESIINDTIEMHRGSRAGISDKYIPPEGPPTEDEIDDFIASNALYDKDTVMNLLDPGLLGFPSKNAKADEKWIREFEKNTIDWSQNNSWLGADDPIWLFIIKPPAPDESFEWSPPSKKPGWIETSPACLLLAADLLKAGKLLSELDWRQFEELIGHLLASEGWKVTVTRGTKDGGIDVIAVKSDPQIGLIQSVWQAKKYSSHNKVRLKDVRELSATRDEAKATKGVIVTTSHLTKGAIEWIKRDVYRLSYKEQEDIENWVLGKIIGKSPSKGI